MKYVVLHSKDQIKVVAADAPERQRSLTDEFIAGACIEADTPMAAVERYLLNDQGAHWEKSLQERSRDFIYFDIYNTPAYPVKDAARYLRIPVATLRSWLRGRSYSTKKGQKVIEPFIQRPDPTLPQLSFINLVEAYVIRNVRETHQVELDQVLPFGKIAMQEGLKDLFSRVDWNPNGIPIRFFPIIESLPDDDRTIFIDPSIRFGRPVIAGKGIRTETIANLINAGDSIEDVANEFGCTVEQVIAAMRFEAQ